jgi:hypothetical protein
MMPKKKKPDPRSDKLPTRKGTAGKPKTRPLTESLDLARPSEEALDERQRRIGEYRKPGGPMRELESMRADEPDAAPDVPPTECDEPEEMKGQSNNDLLMR